MACESTKIQHFASLVVAKTWKATNTSNSLNRKDPIRALVLYVSKHLQADKSIDVNLELVADREVILQKYIRPATDAILVNEVGNDISFFLVFRGATPTTTNHVILICQFFHNSSLMVSHCCFSFVSNNASLELRFTSNDKLQAFLIDIQEWQRGAVGAAAVAPTTTSPVIAVSSDKKKRSIEYISSELESSKTYLSKHHKTTDTDKDDRSSTPLVIVARKISETEFEIDRNRSDSLNILFAQYFVAINDRPLVSDYLFLLMSQVIRTYFDVTSRMPHRKIINIITPGYPGMMCRYCNNGSESKGQGIYFPSSSKNLQAAPPMLHKHLLKCSKCPERIKLALQLTKTVHKYQANQKNVGRKGGGNQSRFFDGIWCRIHDKNFKGYQQSDSIETEISEIIAMHHSPSAHSRLLHINAEQDLRNAICVPVVMPSSNVSNSTSINNIQTVMGQCPTDTHNFASHTFLSTSSDSSVQNRQVINTKTHLKGNIPGSVSQTIPSTSGIIGGISDPMNITQIGIKSVSNDPKSSEIKHMVERATYAASRNPNNINAMMGTSRYDNTASYSNHSGKNFTVHTSAVNASQKEQQAKLQSKPRSFFTSDDDIKLLNGIMKYGDKWNMIWSDGGLAHIPRSLLRDRASTQQFQEVLKKALYSQRTKLKTPDVNTNTKYKWLSPSQASDNYINVTKPLYRDYGLSISTEPVVTCTPYENVGFLSPLPFGKSDGFEELLKMDESDKKALQYALVDNYESDEDFEVTKRNLDSL